MQSKDAKRLLKKNQTEVIGNNAISDFPVILENVLKTRVQEHPSNHTIGAVNSMLDEIASATGENAKENIIRDRILNHFNANQQV